MRTAHNISTINQERGAGINMSLWYPLVGRNPQGEKVELACSEDNILDMSSRIESCVYKGKAFFSNYYWTANLGASTNILITIPDDGGNYPFYTNISSTVETSMQAYIAPTITDSGTPLNRVNRDQNYDINLSKVLVYRDCTYSDAGILGYETRWGSGNKSGGASDRQLALLRRGASYMFIITSRMASNHLTYEANWAEL
jgi:hypothetical protein